MRICETAEEQLGATDAGMADSEITENLGKTFLVGSREHPVEVKLVCRSSRDGLWEGQDIYGGLRIVEDCEILGVKEEEPVDKVDGGRDSTTTDPNTTAATTPASDNTVEATTPPNGLPITGEAMSAEQDETDNAQKIAEQDSQPNEPECNAGTTKYCRTCKTEVELDDGGDCVVCHEPLTRRRKHPRRKEQSEPHDKSVTYGTASTAAPFSALKRQSAPATDPPPEPPLTKTLGWIFDRFEPRGILQLIRQTETAYFDTPSGQLGRWDKKIIRCDENCGTKRIFATREEAEAAYWETVKELAKEQVQDAAAHLIHPDDPESAPEIPVKITIGDAANGRDNGDQPSDPDSDTKDAMRNGVLSNGAAGAISQPDHAALQPHGTADDLLRLVPGPDPQKQKDPFVSLSGRAAKCWMALFAHAQQSGEYRDHEFAARWTVQELARAMGCSRDMAGGGLKELVAGGWIRREENRTEGQFNGFDYWLTMAPDKVSNANQAAAEKTWRKKQSALRDYEVNVVDRTMDDVEIAHVKKEMDSELEIERAEMLGDAEHAGRLAKQRSAQT